MNERIKELIAKATTIEEHCWRASQENFDREKFAELLVKECMEMATELEAQYFNNRKEQTDPKMKKIYTEGEAACDILRFKMKQHFGVEE